jgi:hypothetical protein
MILLWGPLSDAPLAAVLNALQRLATRLAHLDQHNAFQTSLELTVGGTIGGYVRSDSIDIDFACVRADYIRPDNSRLLQHAAEQSQIDAATPHAIQLDDALFLWSDLNDAFVINPPSAMSSNSSKPYQLKLISGYGFDVPQTLNNH